MGMPWELEAGVSQPASLGPQGSVVVLPLKPHCLGAAVKGLSI